MQPVTTADGVSFIRDDFKAPLWTLDACFEFMKSAHARRKIIVIGTLGVAKHFGLIPIGMFHLIGPVLLIALGVALLFRRGRRCPG